MSIQKRLSILVVLASISLNCKAVEEGSQGSSSQSSYDTSSAWEYPVEIHPTVKTVQVYSEDEASLPFIDFKETNQIHLEFDLLGDDVRSLQIEFRHMNRFWEEDTLLPIEYMVRFETDYITNYDASYGTELTYTHFRYSFPNESIHFKIGGNYLMRVYDPDNPSVTLIAHPFLINEGQGSSELFLESVFLSGSIDRGVQPFYIYKPQDETSFDAFDYRACFMRNSEFVGIKCADKPSLISLPSLRFFLEPQDAFARSSGYRLVDLTTFSAGVDVISTDFESSPYRVTVDLDYASLDDAFDFQLQNGQSIIARAGVEETTDPVRNGEYVSVLFRLVPPNEREMAGPVYLTGSFNRWTVDDALRMEWVPEEKMYMREVLLKQGLYEYKYLPDFTSTGLRRLSNTENRYTGLIYLHDPVLNSDRLVAISSLGSR